MGHELSTGLSRTCNELLEPEFQPGTWKALKEYAISGRPAKQVAEESGLSLWTIYAAKSQLMARIREELAELLE
ncbi:MAG: RNA polymerase sigma-70 factor (ECF subfamily) [Mariniblastus sp.]